jgi:hypothetical protein
LRQGERWLSRCPVSLIDKSCSAECREALLQRGNEDGCGHEQAW